MQSRLQQNKTPLIFSDKPHHTTKKRFANIGKPYAHHKGTFVDISKGAKIAFANIGKPDAHHKKPLCLISDEPMHTTKKTTLEISTKSSTTATTQKNRKRN